MIWVAVAVASPAVSPVGCKDFQAECSNLDPTLCNDNLFDFDELTDCCICGGGSTPRTCKDLNNGATDDFGFDCFYYYPYVDQTGAQVTPYCGDFDTPDFSASAMCCGCGGGSEPSVANHCGWITSGRNIDYTMPQEVNAKDCDCFGEDTCHTKTHDGVPVCRFTGGQCRPTYNVSRPCDSFNSGDDQPVLDHYEDLEVYDSAGVLRPFESDCSRHPHCTQVPPFHCVDAVLDCDRIHDPAECNATENCEFVGVCRHTGIPCSAHTDPAVCESVGCSFHGGCRDTAPAKLDPISVIGILVAALVLAAVILMIVVNFRPSEKTDAPFEKRQALL